MTIDRILPLTQDKLFTFLLKRFQHLRGRKKVFVTEKSYILIIGDAPVMLLSHMDTVHTTPVQTVCRSANGNILMSPQGIGGDDRCGIYALLEIYRKAKTKPYLLFTCDEEIGGFGAERFVRDIKNGQLPEKLETLKLLVEIDRKGKNDAVYYDCDCPELEKYIATKGYQTQFGSFSDISIVAPAIGIAGVNLSSGYYNAHTLHEYIVISELENTITKVLEIVNDSIKNTFPSYKYKQREISNIWDYYGTGRYHSLYGTSVYDNLSLVPADISVELAQKYEMLLDIYDPRELEYFRMTYGDEIIDELYEEEYGDYKDVYKPEPIKPV